MKKDTYEEAGKAFRQGLFAITGPMHYYYLKLTLSLFFCLSFSTLTWGQEICDNALDDDQDGLVDLQDPDCDCPVIEPTSLIPNPSFENNNCCPDRRAQMNCAHDWVQASEATTDYLHTCGWMGWPDMPVPTPFPDGEGCVGFRDGFFAVSGIDPNPNWKEYTGACLTSPLRKGVEYRFEFYIGFSYTQFSPAIDVTFFGSTNCSNLPFGNGDAEFGCPTNGPGWKRLASVYVGGSMSWKKVQLKVTPTEDMYAIAIGPSCAKLNNRTQNTYYFFDNLVLAERSAFETPITQTEPTCPENSTLEVLDVPGFLYQWYKDGSALIGETMPLLSKMYGTGTYEVRMEEPGVECRVSEAFNYVEPDRTHIKPLTICAGEEIRFGHQWLNQSGSYIDTFKTELGCDSIVRLDLVVNVDEPDTQRVKVYPGESHRVGTIDYYNPGQYSPVLVNQYGCDSTVYFELSFYDLFPPTGFTPNGDGVNDFFTLFGNEDLITIELFQVFNRWGKLVFEGRGWTPNDPSSGWDGYSGNQPAPEGVYIYRSSLLYEDGKSRISTGSFTLIR